jgi:hypothetical protein
MKQIYKTICLAAAGMFALSANAQIFFTEDFEGTMDGTTNIPVGWTESGLSTDGIWSTGNAAAAQSAYIATWPATTNGTMFAFSNDDACNCDKSADRMTLPAQDFSAITSPVVQLIVDLIKINAIDIFEVQVSTDGGTTWNTEYTVNTTNAWEDDVVIDLSAYIGQSNVLISFFYDDGGAWAYAVGVDEVRLNEQATPTEDLAAINATGQYTIIPLPQVVAMAVEATIENVGNVDATDAVVTSNVYLAPDFVTPVYTQTSGNNAVVAGATAVVNNGTYTPSAVGQYVMEHIVSTATLTDSDSSNDTTFYAFTVTDTIYGRDNGNVTIQLGIGAGSFAVLGQNYDLATNDTISSVTFGAAGLVAGDTVTLLVHDVDGTGMPTTNIHTQTFIAPDAGPIFEIVIPGGLDLLAGTYYVGLEEAVTVDNYALYGTDSIFTPNTVWGSINGGAYQTIESIGFPNSFVLRPNFANIDQCSSLQAAATATDATCNGDADGTATATVTGGLAPYTYLWDDAGSQTTATATGLAAGSYNVTVTDANGCVFMANVQVIEPAPVGAVMSSTDETAAGNDGSATATATGGTSPYTYMWDAAAASQTTATATGLTAGTYVVTITDANGCTYMDSVVVNSAAVGINELTASSVSMYPNPVSDVLTITVENNQSLIAELYDINGKLISSNSVNGTAVISVSNLDKGVYFIQFVAVDGSQIGAQQKLIVE